jgi:hypothetical protein
MKLVSSLRDKNYKDRLRAFNLTTLETLRLRSDLLEVFMIFKGIDSLETQKLYYIEHEAGVLVHLQMWHVLLISLPVYFSSVMSVSFSDWFYYCQTTDFEKFVDYDV